VQQLVLFWVDLKAFRFFIFLFFGEFHLLNLIIIPHSVSFTNKFLQNFNLKVIPIQRIHGSKWLNFVRFWEKKDFQIVRFL
jgi:hypothetical protein